MTNSYPTAKVLLAYTLVGSVIGSLLYLLLWVGDELFRSIRYLRSTDFDLKISNIQFMFLIWGIVAVAGTIPAFITGSIITLRKMKIGSYWDLLKIFMIGFIVTLILLYSLIIIVSSYIPPIPKLLLGSQNTVFLTSAGAISAVIVGKWILPKKISTKTAHHS